MAGDQHNLALLTGWAFWCCMTHIWWYVLHDTPGYMCCMHATPTYSLLQSCSRGLCLDQQCRVWSCTPDCMYITSGSHIPLRRGCIALGLHNCAWGCPGVIDTAHGVHWACRCVGCCSYNVPVSEMPCWLASHVFRRMLHNSMARRTLRAAACRGLLPVGATHPNIYSSVVHDQRPCA